MSQIPDPRHTLILSREHLVPKFANTPLEELPETGILQTSMAYLMNAHLVILHDGDFCKILKDRSGVNGRILPSSEVLSLLAGSYYVQFPVLSFDRIGQKVSALLPKVCCLARSILHEFYGVVKYRVEVLWPGESNREVFFYHDKEKDAYDMTVYLERLGFRGIFPVETRITPVMDSKMPSPGSPVEDSNG